MSMKLGINGGNMEITDDNKVIASDDIMKEVQDNIINPDGKANFKPDIVPTEQGE